DHAVPADHGRPDDPRQQADRPVGSEAMLPHRAHAVWDRRVAECGLPRSRRPPPRQLGVRGRRHCAADPPVYILATLWFSSMTSRAWAFGVISGLGGIGAAAGPLIGGVITSAISCRAAFVFQAAVVATIVFLSRRMVDPVPPDPTRPFDAVGAILWGVGMCVMV